MQLLLCLSLIFLIIGGVDLEGELNNIGTVPHWGNVIASSLFGSYSVLLLLFNIKFDLFPNSCEVSYSSQVQSNLWNMRPIRVQSCFGRPDVWLLCSVFPHPISVSQRQLVLSILASLFVLGNLLSSAVRSAPCSCQISNGNMYLCPL